MTARPGWRLLVRGNRYSQLTKATMPAEWPLFDLPS
jgi:hypothetical protein